MSYALMTVPQLRAECGRLGLPKYQHRDKRLNRADLLVQLAAHVRETYRLADDAPAKPKARQRPHRRRQPTTLSQRMDAAIVRELSKLTSDPPTDYAMYRLMSGLRVEPHFEAIARAREAEAAMRIRDRTRTAKSYDLWDRRYRRLTGTAT